MAVTGAARGAGHRPGCARPSSRPACARRPRSPARPPAAWTRPCRMLAEPGTALLIDFTAGSSRPVSAGAGRPRGAGDGHRCLARPDDGGYASRRHRLRGGRRACSGCPPLRGASDEDSPGSTDERLARRGRHVVTEIARVTAAVTAIDAGDWSGLGRLFLGSHASLRDDFEVSCPSSTSPSRPPWRPGALGARMTGGGFGGSAIALVAADEVGPGGRRGRPGLRRRRVDAAGDPGRHPVRSRGDRLSPGPGPGAELEDCVRSPRRRPSPRGRRRRTGRGRRARCRRTSSRSRSAR